MPDAHIILAGQSNALGFDTDSFAEQADGLHRDATGQVQAGDAFYDGWVL